ncbi:metallopeptidase [Candidatus Amesbacteria bacterium]|nr:metallopeptidase [Candidatus Amesbacteria bacterium]
MDFLPAPDIHKQLCLITKKLDLNHIDPNRLVCFRSHGSTSRARARIWSLPTIWQQALKTGPAYCLEVLSERFDKLKPDDQERVLIHELLHIPKTFSGALIPHRTHHHRSFRHYHDTVEKLYLSLNKKSYQ